MKAIQNQLEKMLEKLEDKIIDRECTLMKRSENWQDYEKGGEHQEKTDQMIDVKENLEMTLESISEFLEL